MEPSLFSWITQHWDELVVIVTSLIGVASIIVKMTPSQVDDEYLAAFRRFFERVALNSRPTQTPGSTPAAPPSKPGGSPPGTMGLLLLGVLAASALSACAPVGAPTALTPEAGAQIAAVCREAADTIRDAADRRSEGILPETVTPVVDRLVMVSRRPCSAQAQALPSDLDRIETAIQAVQEALANA